LKEKDYCLIIDEEEGANLEISNYLLEYHPVLEQQLNAIMCFTKNRLKRLIKINIEKQFITLKRDSYDGNIFILFQSDSKEKCIDNIKNDAEQSEYDNSYYIFDANFLTFQTNKITQIEYEYHVGFEY
jgi:DNA-binding MarR family transcriptional regulator